MVRHFFTLGGVRLQNQRSPVFFRSQLPFSWITFVLVSTSPGPPESLILFRSGLSYSASEWGLLLNHPVSRAANAQTDKKTTDRAGVYLEEGRGNENHLKTMWQVAHKQVTRRHHALVRRAVRAVPESRVERRFQHMQWVHTKFYPFLLVQSLYFYCALLP